VKWPARPERKEEIKEYLPDLLYDSMDEANGLAVFF